MEDLNDFETGDGLPADKWNQVPSEVQNVITTSGQSLDGDDTEQLGKAVAEYVARASHYVGAGTADAQTLTPHDSLLAPSAYAIGMRVAWQPSLANATTAPTIAVAGLDAKTVVTADGSAIQIGDLETGRDEIAVYDGAEFRLEAHASGVISLLDSQTISSGVSEVNLTSTDWPAAYDRVLVYIEAIELASYIGSQLQMEPIDNGSPVSANIDSQFSGSRANGTAVHAHQAAWYLTDQASDISGAYVDVRIEATAHPGPRMGFNSQTSYQNTGNASVLNTAGALTADATRLDGFRIFVASINIDAGRFRMFGLPRS